MVPFNTRGPLLERTSRIKGRDLTYAIMHDEREAEMCAGSRHAKLAFGNMLHATRADVLSRSEVRAPAD